MEWLRRFLNSRDNNDKYISVDYADSTGDCTAVVVIGRTGGVNNVVETLCFSAGTRVSYIEKEIARLSDKYKIPSKNFIRS